MCYIISVHVPTAGMAFLPLAFGWPLVLFPVHVVFLEFIIDPACSIVFEAEPGDEDAMKQPPRDPAQPLFDARTIGVSVLVGVVVLLAVASAYAWALWHERSPGEARALAFAAIVFGNLAMILMNRSGKRSLLAALAQPNPALWWIVFGTVAALLASIYVPLIAGLFQFEALSAKDLSIAFAAGVAGVIVVDLIKTHGAPVMSSLKRLGRTECLCARCVANRLRAWLLTQINALPCGGAMVSAEPRDRASCSVHDFGHSALPSRENMPR